MCVKKCTTKALQPPIKVVLVKEGDIYVTHIYQKRECFRLDELARYRRKAFKTLEVTASKSTVEKEKIKFITGRELIYCANLALVHINRTNE